MPEPNPKKRKDKEEKEKEKESRRQSEKYFAAEGGIELVSSDGVRFRLPAYQLQAHSSVFKDMINRTPDAPIELDDVIIETESVLTDFFDILLDGKDSTDLWTTRGTVSVIDLAQKYAFRSCLHKIRLQTRSRLINPVNFAPWTVFQIAALLNDPTTCVDAIRAMYRWQGRRRVEPYDTSWFGVGSVDDRFFEPDTWWLVYMDSVGLTYLWAFQRALRVVPVIRGRHLEQEEIEKVADEFTRLMGLEGCPTFDWEDPESKSDQSRDHEETDE